MFASTRWDAMDDGMTLRAGGGNGRRQKRVGNWAAKWKEWKSR